MVMIALKMEDTGWMWNGEEKAQINNCLEFRTSTPAVMTPLMTRVEKMGWELLAKLNPLNVATEGAFIFTVEHSTWNQFNQPHPQKLGIENISYFLIVLNPYHISWS
jgi:hypothetical protein